MSWSSFFNFVRPCTSSSNQTVSNELTHAVNDNVCMLLNECQFCAVVLDGKDINPMMLY